MPSVISQTLTTPTLQIAVVGARALLQVDLQIRTFNQVIHSPLLIDLDSSLFTYFNFQRRSITLEMNKYFGVVRLELL